MVQINVFNIGIHKNVQIKFNCMLCCFKNQWLLTHFIMDFSWWRRKIKKGKKKESC